MARWKPVNIKFLTSETLELETDTGHIVKFQLKPSLSLDLDQQDENGKPWFYLNLVPEYIGVEDTKNALKSEELESKFKEANIITDSMNYEHIEVGFIYSEGDPNNHKWMLNFMDVNNKYMFGFIGTKITMDSPFSTHSYEQNGNWHGRFLIQKENIDKIIERKSGEFEIIGKGNIGNQQTLNPIPNDVEKLALRYNVFSNTWFCDYLDKENNNIGGTPCKNIICDVPFEGSIDRNHAKPKVTATMNKSDVAGISLALNALIIKRK